jgi:hypothetical protein
MRRTGSGQRADARVPRIVFAKSCGSGSSEPDFAITDPPYLDLHGLAILATVLNGLPRASVAAVEKRRRSGNTRRFALAPQGNCLQGLHGIIKRNSRAAASSSSVTAFLRPLGRPSAGARAAALGFGFD